MGLLLQGRHTFFLGGPRLNSFTVLCLIPSVTHPPTLQYSDGSVPVTSLFIVFSGFPLSPILLSLFHWLRQPQNQSRQKFLRLLEVLANLFQASLPSLLPADVHFHLYILVLKDLVISLEVVLGLYEMTVIPGAFLPGVSILDTHIQ